LRLINESVGRYDPWDIRINGATARALRCPDTFSHRLTLLLSPAQSISGAQSQCACINQLRHLVEYNALYERALEITQFDSGIGGTERVEDRMRQQQGALEKQETILKEGRPRVGAVVPKKDRCQFRVWSGGSKHSGQKSSRMIYLGEPRFKAAASVLLKRAVALLQEKSTAEEQAQLAQLAPDGSKSLWSTSAVPLDPCRLGDSVCDSSTCSCRCTRCARERDNVPCACDTRKRCHTLCRCLRASCCAREAPDRDRIAPSASSSSTSTSSVDRHVLITVHLLPLFVNTVY
jgi:hypothetical protein